MPRIRTCPSFTHSIRSRRLHRQRKGSLSAPSTYISNELRTIAERQLREERRDQLMIV